MRVFNLGVAGVVASVFLFGSVGGVSAIEPFDLSSVSLQFQREVRSTYIIQFQADIAPSEVQGRANAIAARFQGRIRHTYTRALNGFSIRMNAAAMARLLDADDLGIARISRAVIMTVAQSNDNAANPTKGPPPGKGGGGGGGDTSSCAQTVGWNIGVVTTMSQSDDCSIAVDDGAGSADYSLNSLTVCVLDTGVALHEDLNTVEQLNVNSNSTSVDDIYGHGTHVAGIIGAIANDKGVVGVAPGVEITSIKVLDDDGFGSDADVIAGIDKALEVGCSIVNMSLGGSASSPLDQAVLNAADGLDSKGNSNGGSYTKILFSLAAGNSAADIKGYSPARASTTDSDNIFTIASFGQERKTGNIEWSSFSNYGETTAGLVDFALPGGKILSTVPDGYATYSGTSMAAPHMAGLLVRLAISAGADVANGALDTNGKVQRVFKLGRLFTGYESYDIAVDH